MIRLNKHSLSSRLWMSSMLVLLFILAAPYGTYSKENPKDRNNKKLQKSTKIQDDPQTTLMDINNITTFTQDNGFHNALYGGSWSDAFPKGTAGGIFQEGIVWGGLVDDGGSPTLRVGGNTYFNGTQAIDRIYRVRPDYKTADLTNDAANFFYYQNYPLDASQVTEGDIATIRAQYEKDWKEWPAAKGAPYEDVNGDGIYEPDTDIPGIPGASQTIWIHYDDSIAPNAYGTPPIGLEVQETYWAYSVSNPLSNVIFKKVDVVYKGTENAPANASIKDFYLVQWADPDIGQYTDDFAGCDTTLNLGYSYSSSTQDAVYQSVGLAPAALGYDFLQGVAQYTGNMSDSAIINLKWRKGYKYVNSKPLTSYTYFASGGAWGDPDGQDPNGTPQWYNLMRGFLPRPAYPSASPFPGNVGGTSAGGVGTYLLSGDPLTRTGFIDGIAEGPGDRRIVNTTGPFNMVKGDTAEIVVATIGGIGSTNLSSVSVLKFNDIFAQYAYDQLFDLPNFTKPVVSFTQQDREIVLNWDNNTATSLELSAPKGYAFQGYNIYQYPDASFNLKNAVKIATFDKKDNITTIFDNQFDEASGLVLNLPVQQGTDIGLQRYMDITKDAVRNKPLRNGQEYYYGVTAYGYNPDTSGTLPFKALESTPEQITAVPQQANPGITYGEKTGNVIDVTHSTGLADGSPSVTIVDPAKTTGHKYQVYFTSRQEIRNENGDWGPASARTGLRKADTLSSASIDLAAVYGPEAGTLELSCSLSFDSPDYDYVDGVLMTFPAGTHIISAPNFEGGNGTLAPLIVGNKVVIGDTSARSGNGPFAGGEEWTIIIQHNPSDLPLNVSWKVFDDGYGGGPIDAEGTSQVTEVGKASRLAKYWNLKDVTANVIKLQNRSEINGTDLFPRRSDIPIDLGINASPVVDGFQINMDAGYDAPIVPFSYSIKSDAGSVVRTGSSPSDTRTIFANYTLYGLPTSWAADGFGFGTTEINKLQQDYEIRYTGVIRDTVINGRNIKYVSSGGQMATIFSTVAGAGGLADHPMNPNPGTAAPFLIRVPFEVWNKDTKKQVNIMFRDRSQDLAADPFYAWYPDDRNYLVIVNTDYDPKHVFSTTDPAAVSDATWIVVIYSTRLVMGDVVTITYANPVQIGVDSYDFSLPVATTYSANVAKDEVNKINVFPNPYYGTQNRETTREGKYVTFSHLPDRATIRIFDLSGVLVRTIEKNDPTQFSQWNLQNNSNYPVASGVYIAYIDMPNLKTTKVLKLAIIQEQQILRVY